jgi:hypothetical protein
VDLVGPVTDPEEPSPGQCLVNRRVIRAAHGAEDLDRPVGDALEQIGNGNLDERYVAPCAVVAFAVEQPGAAVRE